MSCDEDEDDVKIVPPPRKASRTVCLLSTLTLRFHLTSSLTYVDDLFV